MKCICVDCMSDNLHKDTDEYIEAEMVIRLEPAKTKTIKIKETKVYANIPWQNLFDVAKQ